MSKLTGDLYNATRKLGKIASAVNDLEHLGKSIATGDPSHIAKRVARKTTNKASHRGAKSVANTINKLFN